METILKSYVLELGIKQLILKRHHRRIDPNRGILPSSSSRCRGTEGAPLARRCDHSELTAVTFANAAHLEALLVIKWICYRDLDELCAPHRGPDRSIRRHVFLQQLLD